VAEGVEGLTDRVPGGAGPVVGDRQVDRAGDRCGVAVDLDDDSTTIDAHLPNDGRTDRPGRRVAPAAVTIASVRKPAINPARIPSERRSLRPMRSPTPINWITT
jgi:hypothetical protein